MIFKLYTPPIDIVLPGNLALSVCLVLQAILSILYSLLQFFFAFLDCYPTIINSFVKLFTVHVMLGENTIPASSKWISPPQSQVLYTEQLTLEGNINSAVYISSQLRRATIHSYSSSNHPESSTPETNRMNSVESNASFNWGDTVQLWRGHSMIIVRDTLMLLVTGKSSQCWMLIHQ